MPTKTSPKTSQKAMVARRQDMPRRGHMTPAQARDMMNGTTRRPQPKRRTKG